MDELTIEQKAKAYEEALERARAINNGEDVDFEAGTTTCEYIFPELKESNDEKIRKWLIGYFQRNNVAENIKTHDILAWLKKQGDKNKLVQELGEYKAKYIQKVLETPLIINKEDERLIKTTIDFLKEFASKGYENAVECMVWLKSLKDRVADKIEPKFHVGDWIVGNDGIFKITRYEDEYGYELTGITGYVAHFISPDYVESNYHLWTIQDAKDRDILTSIANQPFIYNGKFTESSVGAYCGLTVYDTFAVGGECNWTCNKDIRPAIKEQRDLLFQKMKESGYKLDKDFNVVKI